MTTNILLVEPDALEPKVVVLAVIMRQKISDIRLAAIADRAEQDAWTRGVLDKKTLEQLQAMRKAGPPAPTEAPPTPQPPQQQPAPAIEADVDRLPSFITGGQQPQPQPVQSPQGYAQNGHENQGDRFPLHRRRRRHRGPRHEISGAAPSGGSEADDTRGNE